MSGFISKDDVWYCYCTPHGYSIVIAKKDGECAFCREKWLEPTDPNLLYMPLTRPKLTLIRGGKA